MAIFWSSGAPFSRAGFKKRGLRRYPPHEFYVMAALGFTLFALAYWYMLPSIMKPSWSRPPSRGDSTDSGARIEHVSPTQWTSDDVAAWLASIELPQLKKNFKHNVRTPNV
jgi:hypothetical protein